MLPSCLNCHRPLTSTDKFCPSCGQENKTNRIRLGAFMEDFFSNYFAFDSKIGRSTLPFLIKPGFLTKRYNEGKRNSYVHPLRLYLIISFIFFFLLALLVDKVVEEEKITLNFETDDITPTVPIPADARGQFQAALDSANLEIRQVDSTMVISEDSGSIRIDNDSENRIFSLIRDRELTDEQVIDSLDMDKKSRFDQLIVHQARKIAQKDMDVFLPYLAKNFSVLMFLLLPVFAFYLYVLFGRKEKYYISHAIHALHLHSFSFLILTLLIGIELFSVSVVTSDSMVFYCFIIITLYAFFSMKRVYQQGWGKTFLKFNILGFFYFMTLLLGVVMEVLVSFALF